MFKKCDFLSIFAKISEIFLIIFYVHLYLEKCILAIFGLFLDWILLSVFCVLSGRNYVFSEIWVGAVIFFIFYSFMFQVCILTFSCESLSVIFCTFTLLFSSVKTQIFRGGPFFGSFSLTFLGYSFLNNFFAIFRKIATFAPI